MDLERFPKVKEISDVDYAEICMASLTQKEPLYVMKGFIKTEEGEKKDRLIVLNKAYDSVEISYYSTDLLRGKPVLQINPTADLKTSIVPTEYKITDDGCPETGDILFTREGTYLKLNDHNKAGTNPYCDLNTGEIISPDITHGYFTSNWSIVSREHSNNIDLHTNFTEVEKITAIAS